MPGPTSPAADMAIAEAKANVFRLRLAVQALLVHFQSHGYIRERTMDLLDFRVVKQVLSTTARQKEVRDAIGKDRQVWKDLEETFEKAIPSLERRSIPGPDPAQPEFERPSGPLIATNYATLVRDIERINDLVCIGKNVLASGEVAQNNAGKARFDQAIFKIINVCVKVTARGYDGDAGSDEEKWQTVVSEYKKLLINCLHFLNNSVTQNERRKLVLWMHLFDSTVDGSLAMMINETNSKYNAGRQADDRPKTNTSAVVAPADIQNSDSVLTADSGGGSEKLETAMCAITRAAQHQSHPRYSLPRHEDAQRIFEEAMKEANKFAETNQWQAFSRGTFLIYLGRTALAAHQRLSERGESAEGVDVAQECHRQWHAMSDAERTRWSEYYKNVVHRHTDFSSALPDDAAIGLVDRLRRLRADALAQKNATSDAGNALFAWSAKGVLGSVENRASQLSSDRTMPLEISGYLANGTSENQTPPLATEADYRMAYTAEYGAEILQHGKEDLMKRLEPFVDRNQAQGAPGASQVPLVNTEATCSSTARPGHHLSPRTTDYFKEPDSEEDDYGIPGDDGRGLLTDVPLILGPNEIEVLPMIILSGIVPPPSPSTPGYGSTPEEIMAIRNMHTIRCHFLLSQENGRNLLRELLIFVAAWDLREDELYFKFMVKIMEAILNNGLMPFSYHAFRESKDIISPAQAVIMKLLTNIFRLRQARYQQQCNAAAKGVGPPAQYPTRVDVHMVNFLLTEFRRHIIPQTCALIFLQGQIRAGHASPEDFPLNLWDMERMYEGIYQYLEFFAILTECDAWKRMMGEWDITKELVTLLKELDEAIPRSILAREMSKIPSVLKQPLPLLPPVQQADSPRSQLPVAVERPYDVTSPPGSEIPDTAFQQPAGPTLSSIGGPAHEDEPSEFSWKNLKKLTVLVLSSLTWKSQRVQDQVRAHGGIEVVLNCTKHDEFNPYIREHAIMALRFLVEGNEANRDVVRSLEAKAAESARARAEAGASASAATVRKRGAVSKAAPAGESNAVPVSAGPNTLPAPSNGLFDLMKEVMREMPARVKNQTLDKHNAGLLKQLDKEFD